MKKEKDMTDLVNMAFIIDSYAWVEYFLGSEKAEKLKKLFLNQNNQFLTLTCCLAEIKGWSLKEKQNFNELFKVIKANSQIENINEQQWIDSGRERFEQRKTQKDFGLIDAVILVKQKEYRSKVITGDKHFKKLKNVVFLG